MFVYRAPYPTNKDGFQALTYIKLYEHTLISRHKMQLTNSFPISHTHRVEETGVLGENERRSAQ